MKIINRVRKSKDFALIIKNGRSSKNQSFVIHWMPTTNQHVRVGISVSSKLGHAVIRNRIKRQIRAMCDEIINFEESYDAVVVAKKGFLELDYKSNQTLLSELIEKMRGNN